MDEFELVASLRPDPEPSPEAIARDRARLLGSMHAADPDAGHVLELGPDAPGDGDRSEPEPVVVELSFAPGPDAAARRRPWRRGLAAAAALIGLAGLGVFVVKAGDSPGQETEISAGPADGDATPAADPAAEGPLACGSELPFTLSVPDGYGDAVEGPSGDALRDPDSDQLVRHWDSGDGGTIEVRWPSNVDRPFPEVSRGETATKASDSELPGDAESVETVISGADEPLIAPSGNAAFLVEMRSPSLGEGACQALQLTFADQDSTRLRQTASQVYNDLFAVGGPFGPEERPLITGTSTAAEPPTVPPCQAPAGVPHDDHRGGLVQGVERFATPEEALEAFIATQTTTMTDAFGIEVPHITFAQDGYTEITLPDGSIAYHHEEGRGAIVINAIRQDDGWTVNRWEATGC